MLNFQLSLVQQTAILALQLGIILFAAKFGGMLAKKIKMPAVLGELLTGIIIGPCLLGGIGLPLHGLEYGFFGFPQTVSVAGAGVTGSAEFTNVIFQSYHHTLYAIATIGSVLLLFTSGLETDLRMFIRYSLAGTLVGIGGVIVSFLFGALIGTQLLGLPFMHPCTLFLGILSTATSVGITARILSEQRKIDTPEGVTTLAAAVIDDVLGIICLAVVMGIVSIQGGSGTDWGKIGIISAKCIGFYLAASAVGLIIAGIVAKGLKSFKSASVYAVLAFGLAMIISGIFEQQGLAMIIGAYVTGLSLSKTDIAFAVQRALRPLHNFLVPLFFVVMGMLVDIRVFADMEVLKIGLLYSLLAILAKVIGCAIPAFFMNFNLRGALRIGTGMIPRGEVALIIAGIGMTTWYNGSPILDAKLFGVTVIMTLITTLLAPPLLNWILQLPGSGVRKEEKDSSVILTPFEFKTPVLADFVLRHLEENLKKENYMLSQLDKESGIIQIRKENLSFALNVSNSQLIFESNPDELPFIKALMFETIVSLHLELEELKKIVSADELRPECTPQQTAPKAHIHRTTLLKALSPDLIIMDLQGNTKEEIFRDLLALLSDKKQISDPEYCLTELLKRENIASTCFENGISIPHCKCNAVKKITLAVGIKKDGCQFDSLDGKPTGIFVLCLSPNSSASPHIECLAALGTLLSVPENPEKIMQAASQKEVYDIFCKL